MNRADYRRPNLPIELWHLIILEHAVPRPDSFEGSLERQRTLARCCRINRSFTWLQAQLFSEVRFERWQRAAGFLDALKLSEDRRMESRNPSLAQLVKTLRIGNEFEDLGGDPHGDRFELAELLSRLDSLETLFLGRLRRLSPMALFQASKLESLHIWDCEFVPVPPSDPRPVLESLRRVSCHSTTIGFALEVLEPSLRTYDPFFPSPSFPNLRAINGSPLHLSPFPATALQSYCPEKLDRRIKSSIAFLSCWIDDLRPTLDSTPLSYLPRSLRFLRIVSGHFFGRDFLTPYLSTNRASELPLLEELILPQRLSTSAAFEALREWATESGVRITYERDEERPGSVWDRGFWQIVDRVERQLEEEKLAQEDDETDYTARSSW